MKAKLLRKLRNKGRDQIAVHSITKTNGTVTGISFSHPGKPYSADLWKYGDDGNKLKERACKLWLDINMDWIRKKYKKYTRASKYPKN